MISSKTLKLFYWKRLCHTYLSFYLQKWIRFFKKAVLCTKECCPWPWNLCACADIFFFLSFLKYFFTLFYWPVQKDGVFKTSILSRWNWKNFIWNFHEYAKLSFTQFSFLAHQQIKRQIFMPQVNVWMGVKENLIEKINNLSSV
jgi:hypothetical protein